MKNLYLFMFCCAFIPALSQQNTVQQRLNNGSTPYSIYQSNAALLDSLYGKTYKGGLIAALDVSTGTVLICAAADQNNGAMAPWGCENISVGNIDADNFFGAGKLNTDAIELGCTVNGTAANICFGLTLNGYSDWYLPSIYELNCIKQYVFPLGVSSFHQTYNGYWSSNNNHVDPSGYYTSAWVVGFGADTSQTHGWFQRNYSQYVRAVRLADASVQSRLAINETPFQIYLKNNSLLDSLYGKQYQGGVIAYLNTSNGSGIIAAPVDQLDSIWGCRRPYRDYTGGMGTAIGTGKKNTLDVAAICGTGAQTMCIKLNFGGYKDWFLPSIDELYAIYLGLYQRNLGNFKSGANYWSSTNTNGGFVPGFTFSPDNNKQSGIINAPRTTRYKVRAVRYFPPANIPGVKTLPIYSKGAGTVTAGLTVMDGGAVLTKVGVCYSTQLPADTSKAKVLVGNKSGSYPVTITGLLPNTTYYITAFAVNQIGIAFGLPDTVLTPVNLPVVTTDSSFLFGSGAICKGTIVTNGGITLTAAGVCYDTNSLSAPTIQKSKALTKKLSGAFSDTLLTLLPSSSYYFRAFATNSAGTSYGATKSFSNPPKVDAVVFSYLSQSWDSILVRIHFWGSGINKIISTGVCYDTVINPTIKSNVVIKNDTGLVDFFLKGFIPNKTYYVRGFATNTIGVTGYSGAYLFTYPGWVHAVMDSVDSSGTSSLKAYGRVSSQQGTTIINTGFCYQLRSDWPSGWPDTVKVPVTPNGSISASIQYIGLKSGTDYVVFSYAKRADGTAVQAMPITFRRK